ncbi:MAG: YggS family pyridoxal phosphate-dependent enzyme [Opitutaceae bacterium]|jgi:pyridoxal phosphate enzyme (YggS family)|nr:YggS family pyridoxal phosphate-dependent enzyme [Opitutaceae bacterium]
MELTFEAFRENAGRVRGRVAEVCARAGRAPTEVEVLPVTKTHPAAAAAFAARLGFHAVGENRVQEAAAKRAEFEADAAAQPLRWELIGHLQSNKARLAAARFDRVQSVDGAKLLRELDKASAALGKTLPVLLQVNAGRDPANFGAEPEAAPALLEQALACAHLRVEGLMTLAPLDGGNAAARRCFANLREIRDRLARDFGAALPVLSMGMSGDLDEAVAEGSTLVRVGTALFGSR